MQSQRKDELMENSGMMTHQQALDAARAMGIDMLDAQLLLLHALGRSCNERAWLLAHDSDSLLIDVQNRYMALLERRAVGVPVAYLTGTKEFYGLPFTVDKRVLVPRPETETLVEWASELIQAQKMDAFKVLDLGTGSGILAITLKYLHPSVQMVAVDKSEQAISVATLNAAELLSSGDQVRFLQGEWFSPVHGEHFNLIVSNPPYIAEHDEHLQALEHEPVKALVSGEDGLDDIRQIIEQASQYLVSGGWLLLEHGYDQSEAVRKTLQQAGFSDVQTRQDLAGIDRITGACWRAGI